MCRQLGRQKGGGVTRLVRSASAIAAVFAVGTLLVACGGLTPVASPSASVAANPFVGTWRMDSGRPWTLVISAHGARYSILAGKHGKSRYLPLAGTPFTRTGNRLKGEWHPGGTGLNRVVFALGKSAGQLVVTETSRDLKRPFRATLTRLSSSTATPTPVP
jgi:hypothetical protein